ncbi:MAG: hypothetical protein ACYTGL_15505 [Planctomycetota bacterium]
MSKSRTDVVEIQLRQQRSENEGLRRELEATRQALASTRRKTNALRDAGDGESGAVSRVSTSNDSAVTPQLDRIEIRSLLTGGLDRDAIPGDELLSVLVTPVDQSGTPVRPDGMLSVTAFDYSLPKDRQQVGRWEWDTQATESLWMAGVLATGYRFTGAWDTPPVTDSIVLHARFVTPNGEQFDATEKVSVDAVPIRTADQTGSLLEG